MNKLYSVHDHWTDINKKNDVDIESIDGVITGIKVNGEDYGGGGESDFSTAELTLTRGDTNDGRLYAPYLMASPVGTSLFSILNDVVGTNTYEVVVYSGGTVLMYDGTHTVAVSGDIQAMGNGTYLITGDCTITIS